MSEAIFESIVISTDATGCPHIAPFGIRERDDYVLIAPFRPSASLDNLLTQKIATVNFTDDVRVFAGALTGRRNWPVTPAALSGAFYLEGCLAHTELILDRVEEDEVRPKLFFRKLRSVQHRPFKGLNRAQAAVVELAVLVSRLTWLPAEKIDQELTYLQIAIDKTAGPNEREAWAWLCEKITNFRAEQQGNHTA